MNFALRSQRVVQSHKVGPAYVLVANGKIAEVSTELPSGYSGQVVDVGTLAVSPGLVDTHVHINEPGRTDWEGFDSATHAAAAGGITTLVDMPLNCLPVTTTVENFKEKLRSVEGRLFVDCGFWGGVVPESIADLPALLQSGVLGVKSFMIDSGIPEFQPMQIEHLRKAMPIVAQAGLPYLLHAEWDQGEAWDVVVGSDYESFLRSRPRVWENNAITAAIDLAKRNRTRVHIVHLSSSDTLPLIQHAKAQGVNLTVETCPHYLLFQAESISDGQTLLKCCPPIREKENQDRLWEGLGSGAVDFICSDHSPCTVQLKTQYEGDFGKAWGGISSLQFTLPLIWTALLERGLTACDLAYWLSSRPAEFCGLEGRKGRIARGYDADFVVWDPDKKFTIQIADIAYKNKMTPYAGREVYGRVHATYLRGHKIYEDGGFLGDPLGLPIFNPQLADSRKPKSDGKKLYEKR